MTAAAVGDSADAGWFTIAVADELRAHMARKRVSGRELARRLHVSHTWIAKRTQGTIAISTDEIERICEVLGISPAVLLRGALTGVETGRYRAPSRPARNPFSLVTDPPVSYPTVDTGYGSSAAEPVRPDDRNAHPSSGTVNHAHAA